MENKHWRATPKGNAHEKGVRRKGRSCSRGVCSKECHTPHQIRKKRKGKSCHSEKRETGKTPKKEENSTSQRKQIRGGGVYHLQGEFQREFPYLRKEGGKGADAIFSSNREEKIFAAGASREKVV